MAALPKNPPGRKNSEEGWCGLLRHAGAQLSCAVPPGVLAGPHTGADSEAPNSCLALRSFPSALSRQGRVPLVRPASEPGLPPTAPAGSP